MHPVSTVAPEGTPSLEFPDTRSISWEDALGSFDDHENSVASSSVPSTAPSNDILSTPTTCWFYKLDKVVLYNIFHFLLVTLHKPDNGYDCNENRHNLTEIEREEKYLCSEAYWARIKTRKVNHAGGKRRQIRLYPESYRCKWLFRLAKTCRLMRHTVKTYRTVGLMFHTPLQMERVLTAEKFFDTAFKVKKLQQRCRNVIRDVGLALVPTGSTIEQIINLPVGGKVQWRVALTHPVGANGYSILDVWNASRNGKANFNHMLKLITCVLYQQIHEQHCMNKLHLYAKFVQVDCEHVIAGATCTRFACKVCEIVVSKSQKKRWGVQTGTIADGEGWN